jgi:deoxyribodipyrimidine photo-lyase
MCARQVPELAGVEGRAIHEPWKFDPGVRRQLDYPNPIP